MTLATTVEGNVPALHALDPNLPFLASEAAIELDALLCGEGTDLSAVRSLADRLRSAVPLQPADGGAQSFVDPATLGILGEAVSQAGGDAEAPQNVTDLMARASTIANDLAGSDPQSNREGLVWARAFCVGLSRSAAAYRKSIHDLRQPHPFRR